MRRQRPILVIMLGLVLFGVSTAIPIVKIDRAQHQGWEAAEISFRFLLQDFPPLPMPTASMFDPAMGLNLLGLGQRRPPANSSPMDGVMASTLILKAGGFESTSGMGSVFLYWVAWSWLANLGMIVAIITALGTRSMLHRLKWILLPATWLSVLLAGVGFMVVLCWGEGPLLFGPAYWAWLISLVVISIGVSMVFPLRDPVDAVA